MRRLVIAALVAIAVLATGAMLVIAFVTDPSRGSSGPGQLATGPGTAPWAQAPPSTAPLAPPGPAVSPQGPQEPVPWEGVRPLKRTPIPLTAALSRMTSPCIDEDAQVRFGLQPHTSLPGASDASSGAPAVLIVQLEAADGGLQVVDAPVAARGRASDGLLACAQQSLRGKKLAPPAGMQLQPGERIRLSYALPAAQSAARDGASVRPAAGAGDAAAGTRPFKRARGRVP